MSTAFKAALSMLLAAWALTPATAATFNLTNPGDQQTINGAMFFLTDPNPTGTGNINSFVRIQANTSEQGYNTDGTPHQFDEKGGNFTHSIKIGDIGRVSFDGGHTYYREFMLDAAESDNFLTLQSLKVYLEPVPDLLNWPDSFGTPLYDMDTAAADNLLNLTIQPGNGKGDMFVYIPDSLFAGNQNEYLYLYSRFTGTGSSFEEWATREIPQEDPPPSVPEPMTLSLLGLGLGLGAFIRRKTR